MKRLIVISMMVLVFAGSAFASVIQIGPSVTYNKAVTDIKLNEEELKDLNFNNLIFGADVRLNVPYFQLAVQGGLGSSWGDLQNFTLSANATANVRFTLSVFELFLGAGMNMDFMKNGDTWLINGNDLSDAGSAFGHSQLIYRGGVGLNIGFIGVSLQAMVPTNGTFVEDFTMVPNWKATKFTASVLFNLF